MKFQLPKFKLTADFILYAVAAANAVRIGWAYAYVDGGGNLLSAPGIAGGLLGVVLSVGTAFVAGKIPSLRAKMRTQLAWAGLGVILLLEPVLLAPISVTDMPASLKATLPGGWAWLWAIVAALLPSLVIAAVSFANGSMVEAGVLSETASEPKPAKSKPEPAKEPEKPAFVCSCGYVAKSQAALNAHQVKHKQNEPEVVGYVASFEPVTKEKS